MTIQPQPKKLSPSLPMDKVKELKNTIKIKEVGETSKAEKEVKELEESVSPFNFEKEFPKSRSRSHWMNWLKIHHTTSRLKNSYMEKSQQST
jgi:hypothetical protein